MGKQALVLGASGLIGSELVKQLLEDPEYEQIAIISRRAAGLDASEAQANGGGFRPAGGGPGRV